MPGTAFLSDVIGRTNRQSRPSGGSFVSHEAVTGILDLSMIKYMAKLGRAWGVLNMCRVPIRRRGVLPPSSERTSKHGASRNGLPEHGRGVLNKSEKDFLTFSLGLN